MKYIKTGQKRSDAQRQWLVIVDDEDFDYLNQFHWQVDKFNSVKGRVKGKQILIHRLIMNPPNDIEIDHIDGNRLNNQKSNLRFATSSQNKMNRGARKDSKSGYKGVSWHKQNKKWTVRIKVNNKYLSLGLFNNLFDAAKAYNEIATKYFGKYAWLNSIE